MTNASAKKDLKFIKIIYSVYNLDDIIAVIVDNSEYKLNVYLKNREAPSVLALDLNDTTLKYVRIDKDHFPNNFSYQERRYIVYKRPTLTTYLKKLLLSNGFLEVDNYCCIRPEYISVAAFTNNIFGYKSHISFNITDKGGICYSSEENLVEDKLNILK